MACWLQVQTKTCLDILCRAYYGLPLRPTNQTRDEKKAYTISLRASARKGWIDTEGRLTEEGKVVLNKSLAYWRKKDGQANQQK